MASDSVTIPAAEYAELRQLLDRQQIEDCLARIARGTDRFDLELALSACHPGAQFSVGGEITTAVEDVRRQGISVISLNMAGSVPDAADLVVSDPIQAGVMAVMAVADTAKFDIVRQQKRKY